MKKSIVAIALLFVFGLASSIYFANAEGEYVAKINDTLITQDELDEALNKQYGAATLSTLITDKVVALEAEKQKVTSTEADIEAQVKKLEEQYGGEEGLNSALQSSNMTLEDLKASMTTYVLSTKMIEKGLDTSDEVLQAYLAENEATFATEAQVQASHILVADEKTAVALKKELDEGADFAKVAKENSTDTGSAANGGDLGYFSAADMVAEFSEAAFAMKKGEISEPVKSEYGYHIIKVTGIKEAGSTNYEDIKDQVKSAYVDAQVQAQYSQWLTAVMAEYDVDNTLAPTEAAQ